MPNTEVIRADRAIAEIANGTVLCIIDFTEESNQVLRAAVKIATTSKSPLTVLYPYRLTLPRSVSDISQWKKSIDTDARINFARMTDSLFKEYKVTCEFKSEVGFINDRVSAFAEKNKIGMIIIGKQLVLTNSESISTVFANLECPFLIVPKQ